MRLAIISDIHEDIVSLKKIIGKIEKSGYDQLICLGDISGFSIPYYTYRKTRNAQECLTLLREKNSIIIPGNHDYHAARRIPKNSAVFDFPRNWYDLDIRQQSDLAGNEIWIHEEEDLKPLYSPENLEYLRSLPEYYVLTYNGLNILFSHYAYPNLSGFKKGFYFNGADFAQHFEFMKNQDCRLSFTGHAHIRGFYLVKEGQFRHYRYKSIILKEFPICIGVPPVTRHNNRRGFCKFDMEKSLLQTVRC